MVVRKVSRKQNVGVIISAVVGVALSALVALYFSGTLGGSLRFSEDPGYQNVTFTDAVLTCKSKAKQQFSQNLANLVVDNHSSRYEDKRLLYKIFLEADVKSEASQSPILYYVNCFVSAENGRIDEFESFENSEDGGSKAVDGTNMFGFPLK